MLIDALSIALFSVKLNQPKKAVGNRETGYCAVLRDLHHWRQIEDDAFSESQPFIKHDGAVVVLANVQNGSLAPATDAHNQLQHVFGSVPPAEMIGMGAHRADLGETADGQPIAPHCHQLAACV